MNAGHVDASPGERPLRRDAVRNRQRILVAAREVFAERGLAATLDDVAHSAGLGVGTVYRRFSDKASLVEAVFQQQIDELVGLAEEAAIESDSWSGLVGFLERSCALLAADHGLRQVVLGNTLGSASIASARERIGPAAQVLLRRAQDDGYLRQDARSVEVPIIYLVVGSVVEYIDHVQPGAWRRYLALLVDGLRAEREGADPLPEALDEAELDEAMRIWRHERI